MSSRWPGRRRIAALSAVVVALVAGAVVSATPAAHAVPNPVRVVATSSSSSQSQRVVFANCPSGLALYGGSAQIIIDSGTPGGVVLNSVAPFMSDLRTMLGVAYERGSFAGNWRLRVFAICGPREAGLQLAVGFSSIVMGQRLTAQATCPAGTRPYGGGASISEGQDDIYLERVTPGLNGYTATGRAPAPVDRFWQMVAYVICGKTGAFSFSRLDAGSSSSPRELDVACPAPLRVHGAGAEILGGDGRILIDGVIIDSGLLTVRARAVENPPTGVNWALAVWVVCGSDSMVAPPSTPPAPR
jgi:hypothetical protein